MTTHRPNSGADKRRHPRLDHSLPLKISADEVDMLTETINLSCSGAFCRTHRHIEPMTKLKIHLLLSFRKGKRIESHKISCTGVVVRCQQSDADTFNMAIFFSDIAPRDAQFISEFVLNEEIRIPQI